MKTNKQTETKCIGFPNGFGISLWGKPHVKPVLGLHSEPGLVLYPAARLKLSWSSSGGGSGLSCESLRNHGSRFHSPGDTFACLVFGLGAQGCGAQG